MKAASNHGAVVLGQGGAPPSAGPGYRPTPPPGAPSPDPRLPWPTDRLVLRDFVPADRADLLVFPADPDQLRYMLFDLATEAAVDSFLALAVSQAASPDRTQWHWAVEEAGRPGVIGSVALMAEASGSPGAELGYWFRRSSWGRGYAAEASRAALAFGFGTLGFHRIWGKCHTENAASARVMERLGLVREGTLREHVWLRDHWRSSHLYAILDREFR